VSARARERFDVGDFNAPAVEIDVRAGRCLAASAAADGRGERVRERNDVPTRLPNVVIGHVGACVRDRRADAHA